VGYYVFVVVLACAAAVLQWRHAGDAEWRHWPFLNTRSTTAARAYAVGYGVLAVAMVIGMLTLGLGNGR